MFLRIKTGPAEFAFDRSAGKQHRLLLWSCVAWKDPTSVFAKDVALAAAKRAVRHHPYVAPLVDGQVVGVSESQAAFPRRATCGGHAPLQRAARCFWIGRHIAQAHHPAEGPGCLPLWTTKDGGVCAAGFIGPTHGEADQQVTADRVDVGILRASGRGGADRVRGEVGIDQNGPLLLASSSGVEIGESLIRIAVALTIGAREQHFSSGTAAIAVRHLNPCWAA